MTGRAGLITGLTAGLAAVLLAVAGCASDVTSASSVTGAYGPFAVPVTTAPPVERTGAPAPRTAPLDRSAPVGLFVPSIGVRTGPLLDLTIDRDGALQVPPDARSAGWFTLSPTPGAVGPAVIVAHVDYAGVEGVFFRLKDLRPGAEIAVRRADNSEVVFTTYRVDRYPKVAFPSQQVYGNTAGPELRLITCGGVFDHGTGQYLDNVVAYARMTGTR